MCEKQGIHRDTPNIHEFKPNKIQGSVHPNSVIKSHASVPAMCHGWIFDDAVFTEKQHPLWAETLKICPDKALIASFAAGNVHLSLLQLFASNEGSERLEWSALDKIVEWSGSL